MSLVKLEKVVDTLFDYFNRRDFNPDELGAAIRRYADQYQMPFYEICINYLIGLAEDDSPMNPEMDNCRNVAKEIKAVVFKGF